MIERETNTDKSSGIDITITFKLDPLKVTGVDFTKLRVVALREMNSCLDVFEERIGNLQKMTKGNRRTTLYLLDRAKYIHLHNKLLETFTSSDLAKRWMFAPNPYFKSVNTHGADENTRPIDMVRKHQISQVSSILEAIDSGIFS